MRVLGCYKPGAQTFKTTFHKLEQCLTLPQCLFSFYTGFTDLEQGLGVIKRDRKYLTLCGNKWRLIHCEVGDYGISKMLSVILTLKMDEGGIEGLVMPCVHMDNTQ